MPSQELYLGSVHNLSNEYKQNSPKNNRRTGTDWPVKPTTRKVSSQSVNTSVFRY